MDGDNVYLFSLCASNTFYDQKSGSKDGASKAPGCQEGGQEGGSCNPMSPATPTVTTPGTPKSPLPYTIATTPTKSGLPDSVKSSPG